jgi:prepilin-type N-terminal cleavage/methylation domain-containing protein
MRIGGGFSMPADHEGIEPDMAVTVSRTRARRRRRDAGFSFVEVLVTIVLMGVIIVPILAAVRASIRGASVSRAAAEVETVLVNAADEVDRRDLVAVGCDLTGAARDAGLTQGWGEASDTLITVDHEFHHPSVDEWDRWADYVPPGCPAEAFDAHLGGPVVRVTITVTDPQRRVTRTLEVVKGDF